MPGNDISGWYVYYHMFVSSSSRGYPVVRDLSRGLPDWYYADDPSLVEHTLAVGPLEIYDERHQIFMCREKNLDACGGADILIIMMDTEEPHESLLQVCDVHEELCQYPAEPGPILVVGAYWGAWNNCVPRNAILMADAVAPFVMNKANAELYPARLIDVTPVYCVFYKAVKNQWGIIPEDEALASGIVDESMETSSKSD
ncbi:hypothetical protein B0H17DRAFT_1127782 [Mycena rosella]|uniref:Uncharacterized protein n=1 Tax=Mycena rosella TaxID=1033263 RepID=A0AAD7E0N0_MYCRO|nr:hypothetical protein B0H17DRAFT_1127782 [Mycena rosella]